MNSGMRNALRQTLVEKIISGGQAGVDRAALDFALAHGIPHGGWCPHGRRAEDGALAELYELRETPAEDYSQRTEWNVRDSDGTVIFSIAPELTGGSKLTAQLAARLGKPCLHLSQQTHGHIAVKQLREFVQRHNTRILNIAGPRASHEPAVPRFVLETLEKFFKISRRRSQELDRYA